MFVFYWSLISPLCLGIVWGVLSLFQSKGRSPSGQGILILLISLPCLTIAGSLLLGAAQFRLVRSRYRNPDRAKYLDPLWFAVSFMSWAIGVGGIFISLERLWMIPIFVGIGTGLKGLFIDRRLARSVAGDR